MSEEFEIKVNQEALKRLKDDIECKTGFRFIKIENGIAISELELEDEHVNPYGIPYGGVLFTMADDTSGIAFLSAGEQSTDMLIICAAQGTQLN